MFYTSAVSKNTTKKDMRLLADVMGLANKCRDYVKGLPYARHLGYECHSICRAIARSLPELKLVDGSYMGLDRVDKAGKLVFEMRCCPHSWLATPDEAIIDPYPVGYLAVNPVLVVNKGEYAPFGGKLYIADPRVTARISTRKTWRRTETLYRFIQASRK